MARSKTTYHCSSCDYSHPKWFGRCPECQAWNTASEQSNAPKGSKAVALGDSAQPVSLHDVPVNGGGEVRVRTGLTELDNVLGGGLVSGSLVLLGGDPGVGKSTLLLMAADRFGRRGLPVLYVSGEESVSQIRMRGDRLGAIASDLRLLSHTDFTHVQKVVMREKPALVVIDSVQTLFVPDVGSLPGSVSQVREVAHRAMLLAKGSGVTVILVGHVTKSGDLAGPKVLEHFVDTVLHFEGDGRSPLRVLRTVKNRFGPAGELGVFEMVEEGLREVPDASARLLRERVEDAPGTAVVATLEGSRPLLIEVQALVGQQSAAIPARTCVGVDRTRVLMLAAILAKQGLSLHDRDLFVNAAGGVRLGEPGGDLGVLVAIASAKLDRPVPADTVCFGEVGLVGEVRAATHPRQRLKEAARNGFRRVIAPRAAAADPPPGIDVVGVRTVGDALEALGWR